MVVVPKVLPLEAASLLVEEEALPGSERVQVDHRPQGLVRHQGHLHD